MAIHNQSESKEAISLKMGKAFTAKGKTSLLDERDTGNIPISHLNSIYLNLSCLHL